MVDLTGNMLDYGPTGEYEAPILAQLYHTPASELVFSLSGVADTDHVQLSPWLSSVWSVHFCPNSDAAAPAAWASGVNPSVTISGTYGTVVIFNDFDGSGIIWDFRVVGRKQVAV
jgi:hypothetical protein